MALWCLVGLWGCVDEAGNDLADGDDPSEYLTDGDEDQDESLSESETEAKNDCSLDSDCPESYACDPNLLQCRALECNDDSGCFSLYGKASFCSASHLCLPKSCDAQTPCPTDYYCSVGFCAPIPSCSQIADLNVDEVLPILLADRSLELQAHAYDSHASEIPGVQIQWSSLNPEIVSVENLGQGRALAKSGEKSGTTTLMARLDFEDESCQGSELSSTFTIQNFPRLKNGVRVIVLDAQTGKTVGGATVISGDQVQTTPNEGERGAAMFSELRAPSAVHVFHPDYDYISVIGAQSSDIVIPLKKTNGINSTAGAKLSLDFSSLPAASSDSLMFGWAGMAFTGSLLDLNPSTVFSRPLMTETPFLGPIHDILPLPSNVVLEEVDTSKNLLIEGSEQASTAWAFGGYMASQDLVELLTLRLMEGWTDVGALLLSSMSFVDSFYHGINTEVSLQLQPMVPDDGKFNESPFDQPDLNGDGSQEDLVPDYDSFVPVQLTLAKPLERQLQIEVGELPKYQGRQLDGLLTMVGALKDGEFVPLGLAENVVEAPVVPIDEPTRQLFTLNYAPCYSSLPQQSLLLSFAMPFDQFLSGGTVTSAYSVIITRRAELPEQVALGEFLPFIPTVVAETESRKITFNAVEGAGFHRILLGGQGRRWELYFGPQQGYGTLEAVLPKPPWDDPWGPTTAITAAAAELSEGVTFEDFLQISPEPLHHVDEKILRFSTFSYDRASMAR